MSHLFRTVYNGIRDHSAARRSSMEERRISSSIDAIPPTSRPISSVDHSPLTSSSSSSDETSVLLPAGTVTDDPFVVNNLDSPAVHSLRASIIQPSSPKSGISVTELSPPRFRAQHAATSLESLERGTTRQSSSPVTTWLTSFVKFQLHDITSSDERDIHEHHTNKKKDLKNASLPFTSFAGIISTLAMARVAQSSNKEEKLLCAMMLAFAFILLSLGGSVYAAVDACFQHPIGFVAITVIDLLSCWTFNYLSYTFVAWIILDIPESYVSMSTVHQIDNTLTLLIVLLSVYKTYGIISKVKYTPHPLLGWLWCILTLLTWPIQIHTLNGSFRLYIDSMRHYG